jgi:uncharacterized protein (TIGR03118 family)
MRHSIRELQQGSWRTGRKRRLRERRPILESLEARALLSTAHHHLGHGGHAAVADAKKAKAPAGYTQINLVSDLSSEGAQLTDSNLKNPWGMSHSTTSPFWISNQGTGTSSLYSVNGSTVVGEPHPPGSSGNFVNVPAQGSTPPHGPTGQVFAGGDGFTIPSANGGGTPMFIFSTLDGSIEGWVPGNENARLGIQVPGAVFTGLALDNSGGQNYLYAANIRSSPGIDVYNSSFTPVTLAGSFVDPKLKKGFGKSFTPYNIANVGGQLYVTYVGPNFRSGAVAEFNTDGTFVRQIASNSKSGKLQAPWGVAMAPSSFGKFSNDLLVGNIGSGKIDAYNAKGKFVGQLTRNGRKAIVIPGLWSLGVGNGASAGSTSTVYFTAGINNEADGLFGALQPVT